MGRRPGLLSRPGAARNGVDRYVFSEQAHPCGGQQAELYARGEAAGVGHAARRGYAGAVELGQSVDEVVALGGEAEVLRQVDYPYVVRHVVLLQEPAALAVAEAEEQDVDIIERHCAGEAQLRVAVKSLVHVCHGVAGVALAVGEHYLGPRMAQQEAQQLAAGVARGAEYAYPNHIQAPLVPPKGG